MGLSVWAAGQQGSTLSRRAFTTARETFCTDTVELSPDPSAPTASTLSVRAPITQNRKNSTFSQHLEEYNSINGWFQH